MEAPYAAKDEFEFLQEPMYACTASSSRGGMLRSWRSAGSRRVPDEIHKAHET